MDRKQLIKTLEEIGLLLELKGENPFKTRAYSNAARALNSMDDNVETLISSGEIAKEKGFGKAIVEKLQELVKTGKLEYLEKLRAEFPPTLMELFDIPGLGPKKIQAVYKELGVTSTAELEAACKDGRVAGLAGMGEKTAAKLLEGIAQRREAAKHYLYTDVRAAADEVLATLRQIPQLQKLEAAGSMRRFKETTKDMDLLGATDEPEPVMDAFCSMDGISRVLAHGKTKSSLILKSGIQVDLRLVDAATFPYALHHFTGSKDHNVEMRGRAIKRGLKLSEWGLFKGDGDDAERIPCDDEAGLFKALGLHYIPPELREGMGEVAWAEEHAAPDLVQAKDYQGVLHCHTHASDGSQSLAEMVEHARGMGHAYIGITDHSVSSFQANGLTEERLLTQVEAVRELQATITDGFRVFAGIECDILPTGKLDYDDEVLDQLDFFVISVHSGFGRDPDVMTERIIRAVEHPGSRILAHPTGRLLLRREGYPVHLDKIIDACAANGVAMEFNCQPLRMDLDWRHWRRARDKGVLCSLNPDAHHVNGFAYIDPGIGFCRKGWLTAADIVNCWPLPKLEAWLKTGKVE